MCDNSDSVIVFQLVSDVFPSRVEPELSCMGLAQVLPELGLVYKNIYVYKI